MTIFERYGGFATIRKVVVSFYDRVLDSPTISHHFAAIDMRALIQHQTAFITYLTGGPGVNYTDDALERVHAPLHITADEFDEMRLLLRETLEDHGFDSEDVASVEKQILARQPVIVSGS